MLAPACPNTSVTSLSSWRPRRRGSALFSLKPRLHGDRPVSTVLQLGFGPCRQDGIAASGCDPETRSTRGRARGAAQGPDHMPLLAHASADRSCVRRGRFLQDRRCAEIRGPGDWTKGLIFDGRLSEDFKLATGTWVSVGCCAPKLPHIVRRWCATWCRAPDRDDVAVLIIPDIEACRKVAPDLPSDAPATSVLNNARVRKEFAPFFPSCRRQRGTSARIRRAVLLTEPPSLDVGEVTDKGSLNQRAVLAHRAGLVEDLYADPLPAHVIVGDVQPIPKRKRVENGYSWTCGPRYGVEAPASGPQPRGCWPRPAPRSRSSTSTPSRRRSSDRYQGPCHSMRRGRRRCY